MLMVENAKVAKENGAKNSELAVETKQTNANQTKPK
jgi:hypothetical protein